MCEIAGLMVEGVYNHILCTLCCVHVLNITLKDTGKIDWVKAVVLEARGMQMFICNHHTCFVQDFFEDMFASSLSLLRRYANTNSPSLGQIYETFDSMLGKMKQSIYSEDRTWDFMRSILDPL